MVCAGESMSPGQGRNNNGLEIGCVLDAASGLLTFMANGKELSTYYQVLVSGPSCSRAGDLFTHQRKTGFVRSKSKLEKNESRNELIMYVYSCLSNKCH